MPMAVTLGALLVGLSVVVGLLAARASQAIAAAEQEPAATASSEAEPGAAPPSTTPAGEPPPTVAFTAEVRTRVLVPQSRPAVTVHATRDLRGLELTLERNDGRRLAVRGGPLRAGSDQVLEWEQPEGRFRYQGTIRALLAGAPAAVEPLRFEVLAARPLEISVPKSLFDLGRQTMKIVVSRPPARLELELYNPEGGRLGGVEADLSGKPAGTPLDVSWAGVQGEVVRMVLRVHDGDGFWREMILWPWQLIVPHSEVHFAFGQSRIEPEEEPKLADTCRRLEEATAKYHKLGAIKLYIAGYTDTVASRTYNHRLSEARAKSIAAYLRGRCFRYPVFYQGFGEDVLAVATPDETPNENNRRALYVLALEAPGPSSQLPRTAWRELP
jgi:outer membrane protein OmpA-like peptidoglycan-associated protein